MVNCPSVPSVQAKAAQAAIFPNTEVTASFTNAHHVNGQVLKFRVSFLKTITTSGISYLSICRPTRLRMCVSVQNAAQIGVSSATIQIACRFYVTWYTGF